jgi:hypothetical protein
VQVEASAGATLETQLQIKQQTLGETMKTKVVAFRVTEEEYEALRRGAWAVNIKLSEFVYNLLDVHIDGCVHGLRQEKKRQEAKAKRDAKKAAANGAQ